jgi:hypothetical protein
MSYSIETCSIKMTLSILGGYNFLASCSFWPTFSAIDALRRGLHLLFEHYKQWGTLIKMASKPYIK